MARRRLRAQAEGEVPGVTSLQPLAAGGNSTVYRAWQPELDRWVAVKVLDLTLSDSQAREFFLRECSAVGRLTGHPNIVTVLASGVTRTDRPFLTMDLFERGSLAELVATSGPVAVDLALRCGVKLAGALETAHRAGILHRDLKPENVLLSRFGEPGLADFGIATLGEARGGTEAFTASHAAPEVLEGRQATAAADVYGLGSTLWTALAGRLPFGDGADGPLKLTLRVLREPLPPVGRHDVPAEVEGALRWAMAKEPEARPATAQELGERLQALQAELGLPVTDLVVPDDLGHLAAPGSSGGSNGAPPGRSGLGRRHGRPPSPPAPRPGAATIRPHRTAPPTRSGAGLHGAANGSGWQGRSPDAGPDRQPVASPAPATSQPVAAPDLVGLAERPAAPAFPTPAPQPDLRAGWPSLAAGAAAVAPLSAPAGGGLVVPAPEAVHPPPGPGTEVQPPAAGRSTEPDAPPAEPAGRRRPALAVLVGAVMVALVVTAGSLIASRGGAKTPTERSRRTDAAAGAGGTITPAPATPARATARSGGRAPTGVVVRVIDPASVLVSWTPPGERDGLIGYVVVHSASLGTEQPSEHPVNDDEAVEAAVAVPRQGSRCFVVQAVWADRGYPSVAACT